jgi:hypothetical protein
MAIVQLIYLSRDPASPISDFWYHDPTKPSEIIGRSPSPSALKELIKKNQWNLGSTWMSGVAKASWPSNLTSTAVAGIQIFLAIAIAWTENGPASDAYQPSYRYWVAQPDAGIVLVVSDLLAKARDDFTNCIASQAPF